MSRPEVHLKYQDAQLDRLSATRIKMLLEGIPETSTPFKAVDKAFWGLLENRGYNVPRSVFAVAKMYGFSPGTITLWMDAESGWMTEARVKPGAPPIYRAISDEVAMAILKDELTPELEKELMTPDPYIGE